MVANVAFLKRFITESGKLKKRLQWNYDTGTYVFAVVWSPDGKEIASSTQDSTVQIWRPQL